MTAFKVIGIIAVILAALFVLFCVCLFIAAIIASVKGYGRYKKPRRHHGHRGKDSPWYSYEQANAEGREYIKSLPDVRRLSVTTPDGLTLRAVYIPAEKNAGRVCIACHGHHSTALRNMAMFARYYHENGYELIMPDMRGHGESDGKWVGFSYLDKDDICLWSDKAVELFGTGCRIMLHGVSMGAASVVSASGTGKLPSQVRCIVSDCAFSSALEQFRIFVRQRHLPQGLSLFFLDIATKLCTGYFAHQASPERFIKKAEVPFLFIHGDADVYVDTAMSLTLARSCASSYKIVLFEGAWHASSYPSDRERYEKLLDGFAGKYLDQ